METQLAHDPEKKRRRRDEVVRRHLRGDKNNIRGIYNRADCPADRVRLMRH
jgi:ribosome modulation factor